MGISCKFQVDITPVEDRSPNGNLVITTKNDDDSSSQVNSVNDHNSSSQKFKQVWLEFFKKKKKSIMKLSQATIMQHFKSVLSWIPAHEYLHSEVILKNSSHDHEVLHEFGTLFYSTSFQQHTVRRCAGNSLQRNPSKPAPPNVWIFKQIFF